MKIIDHLFEDIDKALDFILTEEAYNLSQDKQRLNPPIEFCADGKKGIRIVKKDSLESKFTAYFNTADSDKFIMTKLRTGRYSLKPNLRFRKYLFRGQKSYYERCTPSLFRNPEQKRFLGESILYQEMMLLILSHPLVQLFDLGFELCGKHFRLEVNLYGMTQHYYNKTSLIDLTSDPNVAAFFATCKYDPLTDTYSPINDNTEIGVLYYYDLDIDEDFKEVDNISLFQLSTIGLQVFSRSERQKGFLVYIPKDKDFHLMSRLTAVRFKHNAACSEKYYNLFNEGRDLFPDDILAMHWKRDNKEKKRISERALLMNAIINPDEDKELNREKLLEEGYIIEDYVPCFTEKELDSYYEKMPEEWNRICDCIHIPGDKDNILKDALRNLPNDSRYSWAFKKGIEHTVNYNDGYLLMKYQSCLI